MIVNRARKKEVVSNIESHMKNYSAVIYVKYQNLFNEKIEELRDIFFDADEKVLFVKNSLLSIAFASNVEDKKDLKMKDSAFLIFSNDIFKSLKLLNNFILSLKGYKNTKLSIPLGVLDSRFVDANCIKKFENISSKEALYTDLIFVLESPLRNLVRILNNPAIDLFKILEYKSKNC